MFTIEEVQSCDGTVDGASYTASYEETELEHSPLFQFQSSTLGGV